MVQCTIAGRNLHSKLVFCVAQHGMDVTTCMPQWSQTIAASFLPQEKQSSVWYFHLQEDMWHDLDEWVRCREYWFWVTDLKRWQILMFYIVFELQRIVRISATRCLIQMGFGAKCSILNSQMFLLKNQNWILPTCDSFPLNVSHTSTIIDSLVTKKLYLLC